MLHDPSGTTGGTAEEKTNNTTDKSAKPAESSTEAGELREFSGVTNTYTLNIDGSSISFSATTINGQTSYSLSANIDISKIADFASKLQSAWEAFKQSDPIKAGILGGVGNFAVDTVVGLAHLATHLPETAIGLIQLGFNLSPAGMLLNPDGAKQIFNGIGNAASEGYDKFSNGDAYTKTSMITYGVAFIGSFFIGAGEAKAASSAGKAGETMNALNQVDDVANALNKAEDIIEVGSSAAEGATFGTSTTNNYRAAFFEAHPELEGQVVVHHAVEQQTLTRYPGVVSQSEIHSLENLRGIPNALNSDLHLSKIRIEWNRFYRTTANPTQQQLLEKATEIDKLFGPLFLPPR